MSKRRNRRARELAVVERGGTIEGTWRGPFYGIGEQGGIFEIERLGDGWQRNLEVDEFSARRVPAAYAAVMANAAAVSQCWPRHMRETSPGSKKFERVTTSPAFRVFRQPNSYEPWPVFITNLLASMQFDGIGYALIVRDESARPASLHRAPRGSMWPFVSPEDGELYYTFGPNEMLPDFRGITGAEWMVPASDVIALRQYCPRHPLLGESPAKSAAMALGINVALTRSQAVFFSRMSRPSGILSSDQPLNAEQIARLRQNWASQSQLMAQGGVPILGNGTKWVPMTITSEDAQLIQAQRMSIEDIARVYRVPLPVIGDLTHATLTNVESLISFWLSTGLGSLLELVERFFDQLFGFDTVTEYTEFDTAGLLRTDFAGRIEALCKGIQGGLYKPNEAREREGLAPVPGGDRVYVQSQMVPLGESPLQTAPAPAPAPEPEPGDGDGEPQEGDESGAGDAQSAAMDVDPSAATAQLMERLRARELVT